MVHQQCPLSSEACERRITNPLEAGRQQQRYEEAFSKAIHRQYPLSNNDREFLTNLRQVFNLSEKVTDLIEARVVKAYASNSSLTTTVNPSPLIVEPQGRKRKQKVRQLLPKAIAVATALVSVSGLAHYGYVQWQADQVAKVAWEQTKTLETEKKYEACINQAKAVPQKSRFYTDAQKLQNQCQSLAQDEQWLAQAKAFATKSNFKEAIAQASKIQPGSSFHQEAQQLTGLWSENLLRQAEGLYQQAYSSKDLDKAINITKVIPQTSSVAQKAKETTLKWRTEWNKNGTYLREAQTALDQGNWWKAIDQANKVRLLGLEVKRNTPYWENKMKPIIETAERRIAPSDSQESVTIQQSAPRRATTQQSTPLPSSSRQSSAQQSFTQQPSTRRSTTQRTIPRRSAPRRSTTQRTIPRRSPSGGWPAKQL